MLFKNMDELVRAFRSGMGDVNGHRNKMGFMFDHDKIDDDNTDRKAAA